MNIYNAIMQAADSIESNPNLFNFVSISQPEPECGTPGCALGWISLHAGMKPFQHYDGSFESACTVDKDGQPFSMTHAAAQFAEFDCPLDFYIAMDEICKGGSWRYEADSCATALRALAKRYKPEQSFEAFMETVMVSVNIEADAFPNTVLRENY